MDQKREALLMAAVQVVARDGLDKTTTKAIAQQAGLNEVYIYRHFHNKEDLLRVAFAYSDSAYISNVIAHLEALLDTGMAYRQRCYAVWKPCWDFILNHPAVCSFYVQYYYSKSFQEYARKDHLRRFSRLFGQLGHSFEQSMELQLLLQHLFDTMLTFAKQVLDGYLTNDDHTREQVFQIMYYLICIYMKPTMEQENPQQAQELAAQPV